ncbi:hypothetical protein PSTT_02644 [Puccinia striiformis]|uniref:Uncharacterized protein n=1 Tax=Puccinia striiformis TaxID=27350 RepID=A0A2S4VZ70_9BASI|nr:hypothetical protein PSTT_02644 [Puccinia striiformis]
MDIQEGIQAAVEQYTSAIKADSSDHVLPYNRAFARFCKALFRRGMARRQLNKWNDALQRRQKKEEKSSGILCARDHNTSISSPTDVTGISSKSAETNPHSASTYSIPPIRSFADFEMRWCMSSEPERRCSVLEVRHCIKTFL